MNWRDCIVKIDIVHAGPPVDATKCWRCNQPATWFYMPSTGQYCDEHVPRGCSCNVEPDGSEPLDGKGRRLPCCEFEEVER